MWEEVISSDLFVAGEVFPQDISSPVIITSRYQINLQFLSQNSMNKDLFPEDLATNGRKKKIKRHEDCYYLIIRHKMTTSIQYVGEQLWRGSLLLSDYLIYRRNDLRNCVAFELGCGVGFLSVIASLIPFRSVYCTDYSNELVEFANSNIELNSHLMSLHSTLERSPICSRVLNWFQEMSLSNLVNSEGWCDTDVHTLNSSDILWIAADVIYDDHITQAFFQTLSRLMKRGEKLWLSLEKRFNFEVDQMSLVAHGYNRFLSYVQDSLECVYLVDGIKMTRKFSGKRISLLFPQYVEYDRTKDIELWEIIPID